MATSVQYAIHAGLNRPGFPGECFICELRLPVQQRSPLSSMIRTEEQVDGMTFIYSL